MYDSYTKMLFLGRDDIATLLIKNGSSVEHKRNNLSSLKAGILWGKWAKFNKNGSFLRTLYP